MYMTQNVYLIAPKIKIQQASNMGKNKVECATDQQQIIFWGG